MRGSLGWDTGYAAKRLPEGHLLVDPFNLSENLPLRFSEEGPHRSDIRCSWIEASYPLPRAGFAPSPSLAGREARSP
jgi:hypothetical protein